MCVLFLLGSAGFVHASGVSVLNTSTFIDNLGHYHIVGEVQNNLQSPIGIVEIVATYYNDSNVKVGTWMAFTDLEVVNPGVKAAFDLVYSDTAVVPQIQNYTLTVTYQPALSFPQGVKIVNDSVSVDDEGNLYVTGYIQNVQTQDAHYVLAIATFYDDNGSVVDVESANTQPWTLTPYQAAPFDIPVLYQSQIPKITSFTLTCQSAEYSAIVPEYGPATATLLLTCSLILVVVLKKKTKRKARTSLRPLKESAR